ncbi:MAG: 2-C-methyl-D-erythritol 2,4-cyclodiphosphate synthase [Gammaproteobacteria bacterium RIFCSPHIGHO2_12_FULL_38_14]|nr:MAG: 2-C-methyl-D-erythritol 2,4-cyclodiphosphate synthase [Gammaproteobacteria bacterium RIFCSPHIGHO2_12_FULL_38_14]
MTNFYSGIGFDVHAVAVDASASIMLCGVQIPSPYRVIAHSDGDVALHALVDAILGAIGEGDIGEHFPDTDMRWKNADSTQFLKHALELCENKKMMLVNLDLIIICEKPRISQHKQTMRAHLSKVTGLPISRVNIKATTTEKLGFLGRGEGIGAQAIVSIKAT